MEPGTHTAGVNPTVLGCVGVSRPRRIVHLRQAISIHMCPLRFANRVVHDVFAAVEQHRPDRTPGAATPPELEAIRRDITVPGWSMRIDSLKTTSHMAALRRIYADHWLARRLGETNDILSTGAALNGAFDAER